MNYKELCKVFNEEPTRGGNNQKQQLARFNRTHEVIKTGRNQYEIVREKSAEEIMLASDKEQYSKYLQTILLNMIADHEELTMTFTYRQIREKLMMVNEHYFPVKYRREKAELKLPYDYDKEQAYEFERKWIDIADSHDTTTIKYALNALKSRHLLATLQETYVFYKFEKTEDGVTIYHAPAVATEKQRAEIAQRQLDFIRKHIPSQRMEELKNLSKAEIQTEEYYGVYLHELFKYGKKTMEAYYDIVTQYAQELGYTRYARAFTITRLPELKRIAKYYAPDFNKHQVERYLNSSRFKTIPPFIHQQLTEKLIQK